MRITNNLSHYIYEIRNHLETIAYTNPTSFSEIMLFSQSKRSYTHALPIPPKTSFHFLPSCSPFAPITTWSLSTSTASRQAVIFHIWQNAKGIASGSSLAPSYSYGRWIQPKIMVSSCCVKTEVFWRKLVGCRNTVGRVSCLFLFWDGRWGATRVSWTVFIKRGTD